MQNQPPELPPGRVLSKRYKIVKKLGEGGFGSVYLAEDTRLGGRKVAVKELHDTSAEARQTFMQEAQLLASLNHIGLVQVSDFFKDQGYHYLVMDFIDGQDVLELVIEAEQRRQMLSAAKVAGWMLQVCEAVAYLHRQQPPIVHRDIKPHNIRLNKSEQAILVDFGIAKIDPKSKTHKLSQAVSIGFSPPEQYSGGGGTDTRSDVYALGATMYCMLTAQLPPDGFDRLLKDTPLPPPSRFNASINPTLEAVILKAMSLNSLHRYRDGAEMLVALRQAMGQASPPVKATPGAPAKASAGGAAMLCARCGHSVRHGARFCPRCGHSTGAQPQIQRCPVCGGGHKTGARFCPRCGANLAAVSRCPQCGQTLRPGAKFCGKCGATLAAGAPPPLAQNLSKAQNHAAKGKQLLKANQFFKAAGEFEQALHLGLKEAKIYANLGRCYVQMDRFGEAITLLETAAQQYPKDGSLHFQLALAYLGAQKYSQGIQTLELAARLSPDDDDLALALVRLYFDMGQQPKAVPLLERLARRTPNDVEVRTRLVVSYLRADLPDKAEPLLKALLREVPDHAELSYLMGIVYIKKNDLKAALREFKKAVKQDSQHGLAHYYIGEIYFFQDKWRDALKAYQNSAKANPRDADPHARMCLCYLELNQPDKAAAALQRAIQIDPNNSLALKIAKDIGLLD